MGDTVELKSVQDNNKEGREYLEKLLNLKLNRNRSLGGGEFFVQSIMTGDLKTEDQNRFNDLKAAQQAAKTADTEAGHVFTKLVKASDGTQTLEDFRKMAPDARQVKARGVIAALDEVPARRAAFGEIERGAAAKLKGMDPSHSDFNGWNQVRLASLQGMGRLREALPAGYEAVGGTWDADLKKRLTPFARDANERSQALTEAKGKTEQVKGAAGRLKEATEQYQTRSWDRVSVFNDSGRNGVGISGEDMAKGRAAMDEIVEHGMAILDNGGTFKDVDALMKDAGLTKEMWPPQLVAAVQAWRKTTRALQDERVRKISESSGGPPGKENVMAVIEWVGNYADLDDAQRGISTDKNPTDKAGLFDMGKGANALSEVVTKWLGTSVAGVKGVSTVHDLLKNLKGLVDEAKSDKDGLDKLQGIVEKSFESLKTAASGAKSGLDIANKVGSAALQKTLKTVIPGLGVAIAGAEFLLACKELYSAGKTLSKAKGEQKEGFVQFLYDEQDEAMLGALANDVGAQKTKVAKSSVKVVTKTLDTAGSGAQFGGPHGAAAAAGLQIASSGITLGSKAIFTGISWSQAKKARKLVAEAQAGSMEAQIEVFEKSGFYSKMYLAVLAKEKNPLAIRYLVDRGIEEGDLDGPTGVEVLRDAMLAAAEQENEQDTDADLLPKLAKVGKGIASVLTAPEEIILHVATSTYQPNFVALTFAEGKPGQWKAAWETGKKGLMGAGLIDVPTGITAALGTVATAAAEVEKKKNSNDAKKTLMTALDIIGKVETTLAKANPQAFDAKSVMKRVPHAPARASINNLATVIGKLTESYWTDIYKIGNPNSQDGVWTYVVKPTFELSPWTAFWAEGEKLAAFPATDPAVGALTTAIARKGEFDQAAKGVDQRKAATAYVAALDALDETLSGVIDLDAVNRQKSALDFVSAFMLLGNGQRRVADEVLADPGNEAKLDNAGDTFADLTKVADGWSAIWKSALANELTADPKGKSGKFTDDGGFGKSVTAVQVAWIAFDEAKEKASKPPVGKGVLQARLKKHREVEIAAGKMLKVQAEFTRMHRYSTVPLLAAASRLAQRVQGELQRSDSEMGEMRQKAPFTPGARTDGSGNAKSKLSSANWRDTYQSAVDSGAVLESGTAKDQISDALKTQKKAQKAYDAAKIKTDKKALLKAATELEDSCGETIEAVEYVRSFKNYIKNSKMKEELEAIVKEVKAVQQNGDLKKILAGTFGNDSKVTFTMAKPDEPDWQKNKKIAVSAGLTLDKTSGVGVALKAYAKSKETVGKRTTEAQGKDPRSTEAQALATAKGEQTRAASIAKSLIEKVENENAKWTTYLGQLSNALT